MIITILGSNGWIPGKNETSAFMVEIDNTLILLDAGSGISNLRNYTEILNKYDSIHIILTHYHLDHIIGLIYLLPYLNNKKLYIYGPGKKYYNKTCKEILNDLLKNEFFSRKLSSFCDEVNVFDYIDDFMINNISISTYEQKHSSPSFGIMINDLLYYATDLAFDSNINKRVKNSTIILHECWNINNDFQNKHTSLKEIIDGIDKKNLSNIYLIHLNPMLNDVDCKELDLMCLKHNISVCYDGMIITIDD